MTKKVNIEGMSCEHCVARVKKALESLEGVSNVEINLEGNYATFDTSAEIDDKTIIDLLDDTGYDVISIE